MNETECMTLVSQAAQLMEQFERRCDHLGGRLQGLMQDMQALATQLPRVVEQAADASMQALPARVAHETREGLGQAVQYYRQHLQASGEWCPAAPTRWPSGSSAWSDCTGICCGRPSARWRCAWPCCSPAARGCRCTIAR